MNKNCLIYNANQVVTCSGHAAKFGSDMQALGVRERASVVIEGGIITDIIEGAVDPGAYEKKGFALVDATGKCVLPGFVDSHTHFVFAGDRSEEYNWRLEGMPYMEIMKRGGGIIRTVDSTRAASEAALIDLGIQRLNAMMRFGVTTVEGKSGYGLDMETELKQLRVMQHLNVVHSMDIIPTFMGAHAIPRSHEGDSEGFLNEMIQAVMPEVSRLGLAEFADIFCEEGVFSVAQSQRYLEAAHALGFQLKLHADEIVRIGGAELAAQLSAVSADHLLQASHAGLEAMRDAGVVATLLPCTAFSLKEPYARAREMIDMGLSVALASDFNPGSCYTESIPLIIALATNQMDMRIEEVITALTLNGAAALNRADTIGSIDIGKQGDVVVHNCPSYAFLSYHIAVSTVEKVIKNGTVALDLLRQAPY